MVTYFTQSSNRWIWDRYSRKDKKARSKNKEIVRVVEEMKKAGVKVVREEE